MPGGFRTLACRRVYFAAESGPRQAPLGAVIHSKNNVSARKLSAELTRPAPATAGLIEEAMSAHRNKQPDVARARYEAALAIDPEHPDALHLLGLLEAQSGDLDRAAELIGSAVAVKPLEPMFHNNLGNVCLLSERLDDAERHYRQALELDPMRLDAMNNVCVLLGRRGEFEAAEQAWSRLLEAAPTFTQARHNLATLYMRMGRLFDALQQCDRGLITAPRDTGLRALLGFAYGAQGLREQAAQVYTDWLRDEPGNAVASHHLAAVTAEGVPERASDAYVKCTFDRFADSFDARLAQLSYRAPELVAQALGQVLGTPARALRIADAGCGTGLCGPLLAPYAASLVGVDLSSRMLAKAAKVGLYDELVQSDLVELFAARPAEFDVVASADTLCYFGALEPVAAAAATALRGPACFVFTVESMSDEAAAAGYLLQYNGRYQHRRDYVAGVLEDAGFDVVEMQAQVLRKEMGVPVNGWLVSARRGVDAGTEVWSVNV